MVFAVFLFFAGSCIDLFACQDEARNDCHVACSCSCSVRHTASAQSVARPDEPISISPATPESVLETVLPKDIFHPPSSLI